MPRSARVIGDGGFFHVMVRGVNKQDIFLDESDYRYYLDALEKYKAEEEIEIYAWCLMTNHVHLLLKATKESLAAFLKKVGCKYVPYFNKKYERIGHLFQERFRSEVIDSDEYLLTAARYIHQNPYKAGMSQSLWYRWSSYGEYFNQGGLADVSLLLSMLGDLPSFERFMNQLEERPCYALEFRPTDEEAAMYIHDLLGASIFVLQYLNKEKRNEYLQKMLDAGIRPAQICRLTELSKNIVYSVKPEKGTVPFSGAS